MALKTETDYGLTDYEMAAIDEAVENDRIKMAKKMKSKGESINKIVEYTELTKEEIEKL